MTPFKEFSPAMLKSVRHERGMKSQQSLAESSGIPKDTIKKLESGKMKNPGIQTLAKLGLTLDVFFYAPWPSEQNNNQKKEESES